MKKTIKILPKIDFQYDVYFFKFLIKCFNNMLQIYLTNSFIVWFHVKTYMYFELSFDIKLYYLYRYLLKTYYIFS